MTVRIAGLGAAALLAGCTTGSLQFSKTEQAGAIPYFETVPLAVEKIDADCSVSLQIVSTPGEKRWVKMANGYGSAKLSLSFENGMLKTVGQEADTQVPQTITAVGGLVKNLADVSVLAAAVGASAKPTCDAELRVHRIGPDGLLLPPGAPLKGKRLP